ncbi:alkene reductase [Methylibium petroleiphilum]|uniref:alkene reductase n=1 Tax=Methylibium petroleiphilum TaxID=105560 RepID=UPI001AC69A1B|nr:alkene reductase [Methylibium petroleiphilum]MBN9205803.1 alkene reductase [Methylibium petroleiphilum]
MTSLFDPIRLGDIELRNRIAMAPLTRNRAVAGRVPSPLAVEYYRQRADAGLIVTEATQISPLGQGYLDTPGIYSREQVEGWKAVTRAVHERGGKIVVQLWHVGRISHVSLLPEGEVPVAPSAITAKSKTFTRNGFEDVSAPRALALAELPGIVEQYRVAARNAIEAGFDGVEVHGANGYLLEQFLRDSTNHRTDAYGGSIENRARLLLEVMRAVTAEIGAGRTGLRLSPVTPANDAALDSDPQALFNHVAEQLAPLKLAFLHVIEGATGGPRDVAPFDYAALRTRVKAPWIVNNGYDRDMAIEAVADGRADVVAFGRPFISNPDLVQRLRVGAPFAALDRDTLYGGGAKGYTDYPALQAP